MKTVSGRSCLFVQEVQSNVPVTCIIINNGLAMPRQNFDNALYCAQIVLVEGGISMRMALVELVHIKVVCVGLGRTCPLPPRILRANVMKKFDFRCILWF